jgi:hypothetical protein
MGWDFRRLLIGFVTSFCCAAPRAAAFPEPVDFDGSLSRWHIGQADPPITYGIEADNPADAAGYQNAAAEAVSLWNQVPGSYFRYAKAPDGEPPQVTIHLQSSLNGTRSTAGYTYFDKYEGNKPLHCMIVILVDDSVSYRSVAKTILHELGHGLGLGHSLVPQAIMSYSLQENGFSLDVDDHAAVARLYPLSGHRPKLPPGCASGSGDYGASSESSLALLLLLLIPLAWAGQDIVALAWSRLNRSLASGR